MNNLGIKKGEKRESQNTKWNCAFLYVLLFGWSSWVDGVSFTLLKSVEIRVVYYKYLLIIFSNVFLLTCSFLLNRPHLSDIWQTVRIISNLVPPCCSEYTHRWCTSTERCNLLSQPPVTSPASSKYVSVSTSQSLILTATNRHLPVSQPHPVLLHLPMAGFHYKSCSGFCGLSLERI